MSGGFRPLPYRRPHARRRGSAPAVAHGRRIAQPGAGALHARTGPGAGADDRPRQGDFDGRCPQRTSTCWQGTRRHPRTISTSRRRSWSSFGTRCRTSRCARRCVSSCRPTCRRAPRIPSAARRSRSSTSGDAYASLRRRVAGARVPSSLQGYVRDLLQHLRDERWSWADASGPGSLPALRPGQRQRRRGVRRGLVRTGAGPGLQAVRRPRDLLRARVQEPRLRPATDRRGRISPGTRAGHRPRQQGASSTAGRVPRGNGPRGSRRLDPRDRPRPPQLGSVVRQVGVRIGDRARQSHVHTCRDRSSRRD